MLFTCRLPTCSDDRFSKRNEMVGTSLFRPLSSSPASSHPVVTSSTASDAGKIDSRRTGGQRQDRHQRNQVETGGADELQTRRHPRIVVHGVVGFRPQNPDLAPKASGNLDPLSGLLDREPTLAQRVQVVPLDAKLQGSSRTLQSRIGPTATIAGGHDQPLLASHT